MDYGQLFGNAWRLTWRNRRFWWLGLFAGSGSAMVVPSAFPTGGEVLEPDIANQRISALLANVPELQAFFALIPTLLAGALLVAVVFSFLSVACQAALIAATPRLLDDPHAGVGGAWGDGLARFGPLLVQSLLVGLPLLLFALPLISAFTAIDATTTVGNVLDRAMSGLSWLMLGQLAAVPLGILLTCAQRETVLRHAGPVEGLVLAVDTIRRRLGQTLLVWLLGLVAAIGGGIAVFLALLVVAIPFFIVAGVLYWVTSSAVPFILAVLALVVVAFVFSAGLNTFLWQYWTLGYAALRAEPTPTPTPVPASPPPAA